MKIQQQAVTAQGPGNGQLKPDDGVIDIRAVEERLGGDRDLLREVLQLFPAVSEDAAEALKQAIAADDMEEVEHHAHNLKGMFSLLEASTAREIAAQIEASARFQGLSKREDFERLSVELVRVNSAIVEFDRVLSQ